MIVVAGFRVFGGGWLCFNSQVGDLLCGFLIVAFSCCVWVVDDVVCFGCVGCLVAACLLLIVLF